MTGGTAGWSARVGLFSAAEDGYVVAVVLFTGNPAIPGDRAAQLLRSLQLAA